ncbi:hypothetical protein JX265_013125 [Neoarthrinium moseri]|uniref:Uncharacterized protein n=1 Tax=Neoarthrinium moseri TaxID=1658444 RepID=A0A9P9W9M8_9PEZI|nr:hypothetical protein JX265_013125 [Neoarthrinium moseri]
MHKHVICFCIALAAAARARNLGNHQGATATRYLAKFDEFVQFGPPPPTPTIGAYNGLLYQGISLSQVGPFPGSVRYGPAQLVGFLPETRPRWIHFHSFYFGCVESWSEPGVPPDPVPCAVTVWGLRQGHYVTSQLFPYVPHITYTGAGETAPMVPAQLRNDFRRIDTVMFTTNYPPQSSGGTRIDNLEYTLRPQVGAAEE